VTIGSRPGRVVVGVDDSLSGLQALRLSAAEARARGRSLHAVRAVGPSPPDPARPAAGGAGWPVAHPATGGAGWPVAHPASQREALAAKGATVIDRAFTETMGGEPTDLEVRAVVVADLPGPVLVGYACRDEDLLVVGTGRRGFWRRVRGGSVARYCLAHAACPVLLVPPPPLTRAGSPRALLRELRRDLDQLADGRTDR
jgi:nucleotide-binding universal stress UspA family protein